LASKDEKGIPIKYREWDGESFTPRRQSGVERLITGSDKSSYYTDDHYKTFKKIR